MTETQVAGVMWTNIISGVVVGVLLVASIVTAAISARKMQRRAEEPRRSVAPSAAA